MTATPYTASITTALDIDVDSLHTLAQAHGADSPIRECAKMIQATIWEMESAERSANEATSSLAENTKRQAEALAGNGRNFDPTWLTHYATEAARAGAKLTSGAETLRMFKRLLDDMVKDAANA